MSSEQLNLQEHARTTRTASAASVHYALAPGRVSELVSELARERALPRATRLAVVAGGPASTAAALGRVVEQSVFGAEFANSPEQMALEYGPYETASRFLLVGDFRARRPAGVMRMIGHGPAGLKSVNDLLQRTGITAEDFLTREHLDGLEDCLDIATLAVDPAYRGWTHQHRVSSLLYRALVRTAQDQPIKRLVAIVDSSALRSLRFVGTPGRVVPGTTAFSYLGSPASYAITIAVDGLAAAGQRRAHELRKRARPRASDLLSPQHLVRRRLVARGVKNTATGSTLDNSIHL